MTNPLFKDEFHAEVPPVPEGAARPLWSVLIPTYNCASYLKATLHSVLKQDPGPELMEIMVVDDHSTQDDPAAVVRQLAGERVRFIRQPANVGKVRNYETGLLASRGRLIHQLQGDDKVRSGFYDRMAALFQENPQAAAAFCRSLYIDEQGKWLGLTGMMGYEDGVVRDFLEKELVAQHLQTPSMVLRREAYETLGGFDRRLNASEDWEMWIRVARFNQVVACNDVLAEYRVHRGSATRRDVLDGSRLRSDKVFGGIVASYVPASLLKKVRRARDYESAVNTLVALEAFRSPGCLRARLSYLRFALQRSCHPRIIFGVLKELCRRKAIPGMQSVRG